MPTPAGHALGALIVTAPIRARYKLTGLAVIVAMIAGMAPDLDLLVGRHSAETHSVGAGLIVGFLGWAVLRARRHPLALEWSALVAFAVLSHALLDWLGSDTSAPIGVMALWPFSHEYFEANAHLFMAVSRRYWHADFLVYNAIVLARELILLGIPAAVIEWRMRRRR